MKQILFRTLSYLNAFVLGGYVVQQFKFNQPIEIYRWIITSFFFCFFLLLTTKDKD